MSLTLEYCLSAFSILALSVSMPQSACSRVVDRIFIFSRKFSTCVMSSEIWFLWYWNWNSNFAFFFFSSETFVDRIISSGLRLFGSFFPLTSWTLASEFLRYANEPPTSKSCQHFLNLSWIRRHKLARSFSISRKKILSVPPSITSLIGFMFSQLKYIYIYISFFNVRSK